MKSQTAAVRFARFLHQARQSDAGAMWRNFASSILLLAVALAAALYSSDATRDGRMIASALSALLALGIALWVGIRFVPRLAANVEWDWIPLLSNYRVTNEGWIYLAAVTVVVFAAVNTANNLLYMVVSALLAVLLMSGLLSGLNFRMLEIHVRMPSSCFAGDPFPVTIELRNRKRLFPSFSLRLEVPDEAWRLPGAYVVMAPPQGAAAFGGEARLSRRGRYRLQSLRVHSRYPFGFLSRWRDCRVAAECVCYPAIVPMERMEVPPQDAFGALARFERGHGYDLYTIRDYMPADGARHVHWKASAKSAALKTREYAAEDSRRLALRLDRRGRPQDAVAFEALVSRAASMAWHLVRAGLEVELITDEWRSGYGVSESHLESILEYLAMVEMAADAPPPERAGNAIVLALEGGAGGGA